MPPFPPNIFGIQGQYDPTGRYWQRREGEAFRDFSAKNAMPSMRIANGAPITPPKIMAQSAPTQQAQAYQGVQATYNPQQAQAAFGAAAQEPNQGSLPMPLGAPLVPVVSVAMRGLMDAYNQTQGTYQPLQAQAGDGGGVTWDIPYGVDPTWYKQFTAEHSGKTPEDVYRRDGEYAVAHALSDKAWGDQFYRTYGRPPSEYDWKASYYQRQNAFYGG